MRRHMTCPAWQAASGCEAAVKPCQIPTRSNLLKIAPKQNTHPPVNCPELSGSAVRAK